jgi:hypothetical protein
MDSILLYPSAQSYGTSALEMYPSSLYQYNKNIAIVQGNTMPTNGLSLCGNK